LKTAGLTQWKEILACLIAEGRHEAATYTSLQLICDTVVLVKYPRILDSLQLVHEKGKSR